MHGLLQQRHLDAALGPELRLHEFLYHDAHVLWWQRRIELAEYLDGLVGVLVNEPGSFATRCLDSAQLVRPFLYGLAGGHAELRRNKRQVFRTDEHTVLALAAAGPEQDDRDGCGVHHAVLQCGERPAQTAERRHLHVAFFEARLLHHQHSHHLAKRFRVADAELLALEVGRSADRRIGHDDQHEVRQRARGDTDDLDVLPLLRRRDDRCSRDVPIAKIARHSIAHRAAAARAGDNAGDVEAVTAEEPLFERDAVWRAGGVVLVLGNEEIGCIDRRGRREADRDDQDDALRIHYHDPS